MFGSLIVLSFSQNIPLPKLEWTVGTSLSYKIHLESVGEKAPRTADYEIELTPRRKEKEKDDQTLAIRFLNLKLDVDGEKAPFSSKFGVGYWKSSGAGLLSEVAWTGGAGEFSFPALLFYLPDEVDARGAWKLDRELPDGVHLEATGKLNHRRFAASLTGTGKLQDVELTWSATFDPPTHRFIKGDLKLKQGSATATYKVELINASGFQSAPDHSLLWALSGPGQRRSSASHLLRRSLGRGFQA